METAAIRDNGVEKFLVLTTTTNQPLANKTCEVLEQAGIPVMLEHIKVRDGKTEASGFRLLVPSQFTQTAMRLVNATSVAYSLKTGNEFRVHIKSAVTV